MKFPRPEVALGKCIFLARIVAKARALNDGTLPEEYAVRFCAPDSVDGLFIAFFGLSRAQIQAAAALSDAAVVEWFESIPAASEPRIREWNHLALNLGRPGFPMAERLPIALRTKYAHVASRGIETIFEMLNADEAS